MKRILLLLFVISMLACFVGCSNGEADPSPSPSPSASVSSTPTVVPLPSGEIHIDSPLVGQWVPMGVESQGYILFQEDGTMVRFEIKQNAAPVIEEQRYELLSENTFRIIDQDGVVTQAYSFELTDDGNTLYVSDTTDQTGSRTEMQRIE